MFESGFFSSIYIYSSLIYLKFSISIQSGPVRGRCRWCSSTGPSVFEGAHEHNPSKKKKQNLQIIYTPLKGGIQQDYKPHIHDKDSKRCIYNACVI
uniref:Uncharacterized protein n=1 Tax=Kalanchoe fedtschenkoi TaxID=63787 RepID=A0A7N0T5L1_KALFE